MTQMRLLLQLFGPLLAALVCLACDSPTAEGDPSARTVSFEFRGPAAGTFQVQGPPAAGGPHLGDYVVGERRLSGYVHFTAFRVTQAPRGDRISILVPGRLGTFSCTCPDDTSNCASVVGRFGTDPFIGAWSPGEGRFVLEMCSVTVKALVAQRARGTFSGSGVVFSQDEQRNIVRSPLTITNGRFDVELHPE